MQKTKLIKESQETFQEVLDRDISLEESQEILSNLIGFFALLHEWDMKDKKTESLTSEVNL